MVLQALEELPVAVGEHRVVQRVLRVEVHVQRGLAHPDLPGQAVQRHPGDAVLPGQRPGGRHDPGHPRFSALGHRARRRYRPVSYHR